jgi:hypothetical protein
MADPFFSEVRYIGSGSVDFLEVAVSVGADVSSLVVTVYDVLGSVRTTNALSGLTPTTSGDFDIYVIESGSPSTFNGIASNGGGIFV